MTIQTFNREYTGMMVDLITQMSDREAARISEVLRTGNHYQINEQAEAIQELSKSRMIIHNYKQLNP